MKPINSSGIQFHIFMMDVYSDLGSPTCDINKGFSQGGHEACFLTEYEMSDCLRAMEKIQGEFDKEDVEAIFELDLDDPMDRKSM